MDTAHEQRNPRDLRPHPINRVIPRLKAGMPAWDQLVDDIASRGVTNALVVTSDGYVVDGETRRAAAIAAGIESVPVRVIPDDQVFAIMRESLVLHKHMTKGQSAFVIYPLLADVIAEAKARAGLKSIRQPNANSCADQSAQGKKGVSEIARDWGFSKDTLDQAEELHAIFNGHPAAIKRRRLEGVDVRALADRWVPRILDLSTDKPIGLGAALAGIAGEVSTAGIPKPVNSTTQVDSFERGIQSLSTALDARRWAKTDPDAQRVILVGWRKASATWSPDCRRELAEALLDGLDDDQVEANQDAHTQRLSDSARARIAAAASARWAKYKPGTSSGSDPEVSATTTEDPA